MLKPCIMELNTLIILPLDIAPASRPQAPSSTSLTDAQLLHSIMAEHKKTIMVYISILCLFAWNILLSLALLVNYFSFYKIRCRGQFPQEALPDSTNYFPSDSWYLEWNSIDAFIISYLNIIVHLLESPTRFLWALIFWFYSPVPWHAVQGSWIEKCSVILLQFFKNPFYF